MNFKIGDTVSVANLNTIWAKIVGEKLCEITQKPAWRVKIKLKNKKRVIYGAFYKDNLYNIGNKHFYLESNQ